MIVYEMGKLNGNASGEYYYLDEEDEGTESPVTMDAVGDVQENYVTEEGARVLSTGMY